MLRRFITFLTIVLLIGGAASLIYFNSQPTALRLTPEHVFEMRLGLLILFAMAAGAVLITSVLVLREGRHAVHQWRVARHRRIAERNIQHKADSRSLMLAGNFGRARNLLAKAAKRGEPNVTDLVDYAATYAAEGNHTEARKSLEDGIKDFGNDPLLLHAIAEQCLDLGDYTAGIAAGERALASYPSSAVLHRLLRDLFVGAEAWERAAEAQRRLAELAPTEAVHRERLLELKLKAAHAAPAEEQAAALKAVLAIDPEYVPALAARARHLAENDDPKGAMKLLEKASKKKIDGPLLDTLIDIAVPADPARLTKFLSKLGAAHPDDQVLRLRTAAAMLKLERIDEAGELLETIEDGVDNTLRERLLGEVYQLRHRPERAQEHFRRALEATKAE